MIRLDILRIVISGSASGGFVVTNAFDSGAPQKILISGTKTWEHGSNPIGQRPTSIVLQVRANGVLLLQKEIGAAEHWNWSIRLDKYDREGREIVYTIDEAPMPGYVKAVDGYSLFNIHSSYRKPPGPQTDDLNNLALWLAAMGLGLAGLAVVATILRRNRRREKNPS